MILINLADDLFVFLADKEWAKEVCKKAEGKAKGVGEFYDLAESVGGYLGDKEWVRKVLNQTLGNPTMTRMQ